MEEIKIWSLDLLEYEPWSQQQHERIADIYEHFKGIVFLIDKKSKKVRDTRESKQREDAVCMDFVQKTNIISDYNSGGLQNF